jgi:hypothetical protein
MYRMTEQFRGQLPKNGKVLGAQNSLVEHRLS